MQMKLLLAVLLPVKGSYVGYATTGWRSVRGNGKSALLGTVCAALLPSSLPSAVVRSINVRTTCSGLASEMRIVLRTRRVHFISVLCRVAIKLNTESLTIYEQCEEIDFADEWMRTARLRNSFTVPSKLFLRTKIDAVNRKPQVYSTRVQTHS